MFYNYLIVTLRNLRNNPGFTSIKVLSLSLGLICSILVLMHVQYTSSYDKHFDNYQNIYRVVTSLTSTSGQRIDASLIAEGIFNPLLQDYGQIQQAAKISDANGLFVYEDVSATNDYWWVDPEFLNIFSFVFVQGNPETALSEPNTIVLTETTARKYFGQGDPMGKVLRFDHLADLRVTAIIRDLPPNTHLDIEAMIGSSTGRQIISENFMNRTAWAGFGGTMLYVVIDDPASVAAMRADLANFINNNVPDTQRDFVQRMDMSLDLEPLADLHLSPRQGFAAADYSRTLVLGGLIAFAVLILLSSCINFANLSLAQMQQRGKETGVRKTLGATRTDLLTQFLVESMLLTLLALLLALPVIYLAIGPYTALTGTAFSFGSMFGSSQVLIIVAFVLLTGFLSGLVPALRMSRFAPTAAISGKRDGGRSSRLVRAGLTVIQFTFAVVLIILAIGIGLQVRYLNEIDTGFNRNNLVVLNTRYNPLNPDQFNYDALVDELRQHPGIVTIGKSENAPPYNGGFNPWRHSSQPVEEAQAVSHLGVDEYYVDAMQLELLAGRNFSQDFQADYLPDGQPEATQTYGILVTPAAVAKFGLGSVDEAVDEVLMIGTLNFQVVGVVNDFRLSGGMEDTMRSTAILRATRQPMRTLLIRIDPLQRANALNHIDAVWARHRPDAPIDREFYEQTFSQQIYEQTNGINRAAQFAALITIVIAALGLYALAYYSTERRTKEIGIRKVLGATARSIVELLSLDFIKPVLVACVLASGLAYLATSYYFDQFSAQASLSPLIFVLVIAGTIALSLLTVAAQCIKTARSDPVASLRSE
ncbi:MAG: FtsX-like permease family protein [Pseudohongiella sp.]|uniref:ABC transporter permease n=1 Tax=Pseudohongiella sp. TaxID=1979412 RepID=UPI0034A0ACB4